MAKNIHNNIVTDVYMNGDVETEFSYYTNPSMGKKISFVTAVVGIVADDDYYYPMIRDMVFDFCLVNYFSNIDPIVTLDDNGTGETIDDVERFLESTNAATVMKLGMDFDIIQELSDCVDKAIEYKTGIHQSPIADGIASIFDTLEQKFADIDMDAMTGMAKVFGKLQGDITPDKMLEAYANSDVFKKMHGDAVKKQEKWDKKAEDRLNVVKGNLSLDAGEIKKIDDGDENNLKHVNGLEIV